MSIWFQPVTVAQLNKDFDSAMIHHLGIQISQIQDNALIGTMPVDERTRQPFGLLHGGASMVLAETLGSLGSYLCVDSNRFYPAGQSIYGNHIKSIAEGIVTGTAKPVHLGGKSHLWQIEIRDNQEALICTAQLTTRILTQDNLKTQL
ncbi:hotdog fold thioesterase [Candidatus Venteria ishoeyi]|uniref:Esterase YdiI n=1 Tax=Candidatus Venteria ishoeyi TaxID=1899563 RepID=A0A1H6FDL2_9GAMM|nr:hotdog fold thioesterase [Candidatus Venteria ishoeyi]SEH08137.1 Esterase YdiI [Candidatus Venteria ishoeyi]